MKKNYKIYYNDIALLPSMGKKEEARARDLGGEDWAFYNKAIRVREIAVLSPDKTKFVFVSEFDEKTVREVKDYAQFDKNGHLILPHLFDVISFCRDDGETMVVQLRPPAGVRCSMALKLDILKKMNESFWTSQMEALDKQEKTRESEYWWDNSVERDRAEYMQMFE